MAQVRLSTAVLVALAAGPGLAMAAGPEAPAQSPAQVQAQAQAQAQAPSLADQARVRMGEGDLSGAIDRMRAHVGERPDDRQARLDLVRYLTWSGDYAAAEETLLADAALATSEDGVAAHAMLLAWAGRLDAAQGKAQSLLDADADHYLGNYAMAIALRQTTIPRTSFPHVEAVKRVRTDSPDSRTLERASWALAASYVALDVPQFRDSADLSSFRPLLRARVVLDEHWAVTGEYGRWDHRAPLGSPFAPIQGGRSVSQTRGMVGARWTPDLRTALAVSVGRSAIEGDTATIGQASIDYRASDDWTFAARGARDRVMASPRSISLDIMATSVQGQARWTPDMRWTGEALLRVENLSDGNRGHEANIALRRAVVRSHGWMVDLGGQVQRLSYRENPGNGYYAPNDYWRVSATVHSYRHVTDDIGLSMQGTFGMQRDENTDGWRRANDVRVELIAGIFSPWQVNGWVGYSDRASGVGLYEGRTWGVSLMRRF